MSRVQTSDFASDSYAVWTTLKMQPQVGFGREGYFYSRDGIVEVWVSYSLKWPATQLRFVHDGRTYTRRWGRPWGDKTISRLAREFAEDVVGGRA